MSDEKGTLDNENTNMWKEEDGVLARRAKAGDLQARETLILKNLSLVHHLLGKFKGKGVPYDVLYQEGCYGLILAVDKYDPDIGTTFGTYAGFYIDKYLHLAMMENSPHPIILKYKSSRNAKGCKTSKEILREKNGREPSINEIADHLGISYQEAVSIMNGTVTTVSFDDPNAINLTPPFGYDRDTETEALNNLNEMCLDAFPVTLTKREQDVLYFRFGFGPKGEPLTFGQIGSILGMCDDTAGKICRDALRKLRDSVSEQEF